MNFFERVIDVLKPDERFFTAKGELLRNAVYEAAMKMDAKLIKALYENDATKERFFTDVDGIAVFDKVGFGWVINNREFLPDSYTRYKNKIGLADGNGNYIATSNDVELFFPYKDCVLEGGQTKDDQKRSEVFYNKTLAPDEVDRLLYPKVFTNAKKYSADGTNVIDSIDDSENLVIKGNNLLSIASLLKKYEGEVKCIYIDVPYNTGNDSFGYNDKFNHSTWLTFMKTRLEIAYRLLHRTGTIAISVDNYEIAYLLVLLDEVFGKENRKNIVTVKRGSVTGAKVINPGVVNVVEYVVLYSKETSFWKPNRVYSAKGYDDRYGNIILNFSENYVDWEFGTVLDEFAKSLNIKKSKLRAELGGDYDKALEDYALANAYRIVQFATLDDNSISAEARTKKKESIENNSIIFFERGDEKPYYIRNGKLILFAKDRLVEIDGKLTFAQPISDIWDDVLPNDLHNEGGVEFKKGKKPEKLLGRIIELCTDPKDLVIDFFAGSGTTGAVAMKLGRRFILCEQMDYIEDTICTRLNNTIAGDSRGISVDSGWRGGGSYVYCELAKLNQKYTDKIQIAADDDTLVQIWTEMQETGFISSKIDPREIDTEADDFKALSLDDKKKLLMELLDLNQLYINYCDIDDETFAVSDADKAFTKSFYGEE
ncbi:MAG: site-specific DNA-methyltransferase [Eubacteriales bacterium]|nr:site-specific DNA-methyltransferase [Eubacteriales bacterium]